MRLVNCTRSDTRPMRDELHVGQRLPSAFETESGLITSQLRHLVLVIRHLFGIATHQVAQLFAGFEILVGQE
jgi:hypothetical protein